MRKLLRGLAYPTPTNIAVWEECYWRWRSLCELVVQPPVDPVASRGWSSSFQVTFSRMRHVLKLKLSQEKLVQWRNLTLFLAAFCAVCVQENHDPSALTSVIPTQYLPDELHNLANPITMVSTFITDLTDLLIAESAQIREVARDALGTELSPRLYGRLFRHLEELVSTSSVSLLVTHR